MGKAAIAGISLILVVAVVIGAVVVVNHHGKGGVGTSENGTPSSITSGMKAAETLCAPTDHKEACMETLRPVAEKDGHASPQDFVAAAFEATMNEVKKALDKSGSLKASKEYDRLSMKSCKDLMDAAEYELEAAIEKVKAKDHESIEELLDDLNAWLSSVSANSESCLDDLQNPELKKSMKEILEKAGQLTDNALAIIDEVASLLGGINITLPSFGQTSRRLLAADGFPTWVSAADRKLLQAGNRPRPNAVVAKDGSGQYKTITEAINAVPQKNKGKFVIYVKAGIYQEYVEIPKKVTNVHMYGDGHDKTIIRGDKNFEIKGIPTMQTATFAVMGNGFFAADIGFENTAGAKGHQAVALRVQSDLAIFTRCRMDGYQDTFYYQSLRSFYHDCIIYGTIDYIFGRGTAVIQNSKIITRMPLDNQFNTVTADGRQNRRARTGLVIQNCELIADAALAPNKARIQSYLGRPWSPYSTTMVMESQIGDFLNPEGWKKWDPTGGFENTCEYREYANAGPGADVGRRVNWPGFRVLDKTKAQRYTVQRFARGGIRALRPSGIPFSYSFAH